MQLCFIMKKMLEKMGRNIVFALKSPTSQHFLLFPQIENKVDIRAPFLHLLYRRKQKKTGPINVYQYTIWVIGVEA